MTLDLGGGLIPMQNWYAPSLSDRHEAGVAEWSRQSIVDLLKNGATPQASGEGAPGIYPALAGNRAVTLVSPANLVRVVLEGGFAPSTTGNPRPCGMPPFATVLSAADTAAVLDLCAQRLGQPGLCRARDRGQPLPLSRSNG